MITRAEVESKLSAHLAMMQDWAEGRRSWTNTFSIDHEHPELTTAYVGIADTQEVAKHAAAVQAYVALLVALT